MTATGSEAGAKGDPKLLDFRAKRHDQTEKQPTMSKPAVPPEPPKATPAAPRRFSWLALTFTLVIFLILLNVGVLLYTAKNSAELEKSHREIALMQRIVEQMKVQMKSQEAAYKKLRGEAMAQVKADMAAVDERVGGIETKLRTGLFTSGSSVVLSAPGNIDPQVFAKPASQQALELQYPATTPEELQMQGVNPEDLPRYDRKISPDGKLILRRVN
jgi:hypothetical protein